MDFSKTVEAAGGYGERLSDPAEVPAAISRCLAQVRAGRRDLLHACVTKL
jgi:acetolactate synthase-1/2/3 large subunit